MFNPLRLLGRKEHIDDAASAYIEGRATASDEAELQRRAALEPGLMDDLASIRATVSLLRSVETVRAPRSFALAEAPVQVKVRRQRLAMAPAVFAIAAAAIVGLLAVGNLADVVHQDGISSSDSSATRAVSQESAGATGGMDGGVASDDASGLAEMTGPATDSDVTLSAGSSADSVQEPESGATAPSFALATPTPLATAMAAVPIAPDSELGTAAGDRTEAALDGADTDTAYQNDEGLPPEPEDDTTAKLVPSPLPEATIALAAGSGESAATVIEEPNISEPVVSDDRGISLPLWQLQLGFSTLAVLMAGAWFALQRKLTA